MISMYDLTYSVQRKIGEYFFLCFQDFFNFPGVRIYYSVSVIIFSLFSFAVRKLIECHSS